MRVLLHTLQLKVKKYTESNGLPLQTTLMHECTLNQYEIVARVNIKHEDQVTPIVQACPTYKLHES